MSGQIQTRLHVPGLKPPLARKHEGRQGQHLFVIGRTGRTAHRPARAGADIDQVVHCSRSRAFGQVEAKAQVLKQAGLVQGGDNGFVELALQAARAQGARLLPNTAGCHTAREAIQLACMARELYGTAWIKLEVIGDAHTLQPDPFELLEAARSRLPPVIQPESFEQEGTRVICYPGDERHSVRTQALPGPTRLIYRNKRFEPMSGFEGLFA